MLRLTTRIAGAQSQKDIFTGLAFGMIDQCLGFTGVDVTKPDLVLMDMTLPVKDGWVATAELKADPLTRPIPVIGLSAHAMAGDRDRAMESGCDDYGTKPIELDRLVGKIEALLGRATV
jgi:CheY-like chemotaxis protein